MSVLERSLHFGPGTSVTSPLRWKGRKSGFRAFLLLLTLDTCPQSRPWECGNPKGISKECGKGGKPASWLSILSIFCHFHGLLWNACSKSEGYRKSCFQRTPANARDSGLSCGLSVKVKTDGFRSGARSCLLTGMRHDGLQARLVCPYGTKYRIRNRLNREGVDFHCKESLHPQIA